MMDQHSILKRLSGYFNWLDSVDIIIYGGLGLALLTYAIYSLCKTLIEAENYFGLFAVSCIVLLSVTSLVRDLKEKHLSMPSKFLVGAWALCVGIVVLIELFEMAG